MSFFGGTTVSFVSLEDSGTRGPLGTHTQTEVVVDVPGCRHRPMEFHETAAYDVDIATEMYRTTAPPDAAVLAATADGELRVNGDTYQIIGGPRVFDDFNGLAFKVTIVSKRLTG